MIDLRSDTVTRPSPEMLKAMQNASVGDDVFGEDPTVIALEEKAAGMFGMEAAIYCPSGTMTNQIAVKVHTTPGSEVICDRLSHIYNYEGGGIAFNSGCSIRLIQGNRGRFSEEAVAQNLNPDDVHFPETKLVSVENTVNKGGGCFYEFAALQCIYRYCKKHGLKFHLDGARLFNALVETKESPEDYGKVFDTISICLSKGLGAPVGSLLLGNRESIKQARRIRKVFGGGMRQAGYLAAAGIYALGNNVERLKEDHRKAKELGNAISGLKYVKDTLPVDTNIVVFTLNNDVPLADFLEKLKGKGVVAVPFGHQTVRMVTHLDITDQSLKKVIAVLKGLF